MPLGISGTFNFMIVFQAEPPSPPLSLFISLNLSFVVDSVSDLGLPNLRHVSHGSFTSQGS
jgi:hypothetical protein